MWQLFVRFIILIASVFNEFLSKNGPYMAASISFYSLFSLFPLLLALISIFGFFLGFKGFEERLLSGLQEQIPVVNEDIISGVLRTVAEGRAVSSIMAAFGLLWASTAVFGAIRKSINIIWDIQRTRPFLLERAMDFALMFGASSLLFVSLFATTALGFLRQIFEVLFPDSATSTQDYWQKVAVIIPALTTYSTFLILYTWLPNIKVRLAEAALPALGAAMAFEIAKIIFVLYLRNFEGYNDVYGAVGAVIALLAWVYVSAIILLVGALLTSRFAVYLSTRDQSRRLYELAKNLARVRSRPALSGFAAPTN